MTQNNQGYITLEQKYKIVWSIKNPENFILLTTTLFFIGKAGIICSNNYDEIFYLFSILNNPINKYILLKC